MAVVFSHARSLRRRGKADCGIVRAISFAPERRKGQSDEGKNGGERCQDNGTCRLHCCLDDGVVGGIQSIGLFGRSDTMGHRASMSTCRPPSVSETLRDGRFSTRPMKGSTD